MRGRKNGPEQGEGGGELAGPREEMEVDSAQEKGKGNSPFMSKGN